MNYHEFDKNGEATLMRGFAQQIIMLKKPTLSVVQDIGAGIGLMILKRQQYDQLISDSKEAIGIATVNLCDNQQVIDKQTKLIETLRLILVSQNSDDQKVFLISKLLIDETVSH